jgi:hypothetical protein
LEVVCSEFVIDGKGRLCEVTGSHIDNVRLSKAVVERCGRFRRRETGQVW